MMVMMMMIMNICPGLGKARKHLLVGLYLEELVFGKVFELVYKGATFRRLVCGGLIFGILWCTV